MTRSSLPLVRPRAVGFAAVVLAGAMFASDLHAERPHLVPAPVEPGTPPLMGRNKDGSWGPVMIDADFVERADRFRREHPLAMPARGDMLQVGDVLLLQGDDVTVQTDGTGYAVRDLGGVAQRVIEQAGDNFDFITVWLTFDDKASPMAGAYEATVNQEVAGIGQATYMRSGTGSAGRLKSILNMKRWPLSSKGVPDGVLHVWGQESAHRWLMTMLFVDPRTGKASDLMLGRQCAHYNKFVDSQASIEDGFAWRDEGPVDPSMPAGLHNFTATGVDMQYGNLDLYGMGLLAADDLPPFFLIDEIPGYTSPRCGTPYDNATKPSGSTVKGKRIDIDLASIVAANGERVPTADETKGYYREAIVFLMQPTQNPPDYAHLGTWMNVARVQWEDWNRPASQHRQVICTQISQDCGDPRSDVVRFDLKPNTTSGGVIPSAGAFMAEVEVKNGGGRDTTGVKAGLRVEAGSQTIDIDPQDIGDVAVGDSAVRTFTVDLTGVSGCGEPITMKAWSQSEYHYNRLRKTIYPGIVDKDSDGFETDSGWTVDPDGDDDGSGSTWERATPQKSSALRTRVQPDGAHGGANAWVTGAASAAGSWVAMGKATLQSVPYDTAGLRDPMLRYWVSFAGIKSVTVGGQPTLVTSDASSLTAYAKTNGDWVEVDRLQGTITPGWVQHNIRLPLDKLPLTGKLQLRFVAEDANPAQGAVEAAIDDVEITSNVPECYGETGDAGADGGGGDGAGADGSGADAAGGSGGGKGCGCRLGEASGPGAAGDGLGLLVIALAVLRRARRRAIGSV